ncbi:hypothetical protein [Botrimarina colliarenosi]|uniref:hypothetical protein n=1 Tax=Botrimarina colliarenosi TaxID=2528001 RepID=UPI0011B6EE37|nr:hypothetical protein [Botrimarina colliarenosi]
MAAASPLGAPGEASAAITTYAAEHEIRLNSQQPFTSNIFRNNTSSPALGATPYSRSETQGFGQFEVRASQDVTVAPNRIQVDLSVTMFDVGDQSGGIASSKLELRFTLDAPANLFVSGSATGNDGPFSGGRSLSLLPVPGGSNDYLIATSGLDAINYTSAIPRPIALSAGIYDLILTNSLANRAVGTRTNSAFLQFLPADDITGDYNGDGKVDAADYTVWRDGNTSDSSPAGYNLWANNFGATAATPSIAVPEPSASLVATLALTMLLQSKWRRG